jgi:hypothetical protein
MQSPRKKRPLPLHVSQARIQAERENVARRTRVRIASVNAVAQHGNRMAPAQATENWNYHCCLNTFCFCVLLLLLNLLFLQWLYYNSVQLPKL